MTMIGTLRGLDTDATFTNASDGTASSSLAIKTYVDNVASGRDFKESCRAATTAALAANTYDNGTAGVGATLTANANGALAAVDGVTLVLNDRLLVQDEATAANNGIYVVTQVGTAGTPYILTRATDANSATNITAGMTTTIEEGTVNADLTFTLTTNNPITVGTTALNFTMTGGAGDVVGPASSTDNALARFDGATGKLLQNSGTTLSDTGLLTMQNPIDEFQGANIASATTTNIGAATGNYVNITGTTQIDAFDTIQAGTRRVLNFNGILQLTYNGTSMILPTGANITTAAGDTATFISLGSGNWICTEYQRADGTALASSGSGDVVGPASSVDNAIVVFDSTTGKLIQQESATGTPLTLLRGTTTTFGSIAITERTVAPPNGSTIFGFDAGDSASLTGTNSTLIGCRAGLSLTSGGSQVAIGCRTLESATTGGSNVAVGYAALQDGTSGTAFNTVVGATAVGSSSGEKFRNVVLGFGAGSALGTSNDNILVGYQAGNNITSGSANLIIGYDLDPPSATASNQMNIGGVIDGFVSTGTAPGIRARVAPIPSADLTGSGLYGVVTVDTNAVGIGAALFLAADGNYDEADAGAAATMPCTAVALETSTGSKQVLFNGFIRNDAWTWTPGGNVYVSTTQGTFTQTAPSTTGEQVQIVGVAQSADVIYFNPSLSIVEVA